MINIDYYNRYYFSKSKPIPYKLKCGVDISIYPILVEDIEMFEDCVDILLIDKDSFQSVDIIKMSYLEFLKEIQFTLPQKVDKNMTYGELQQSKFANLMHLCLKENHIGIMYEKNKAIVVIGNDDETLKAKITNKEFQEISKIILYQNILGYDDRKLDANVQKLYDDYLKLKNKDLRNPTIEDKKQYIMAHNGWNESQIDKITYRRFEGIFDCLIGDAQYYGNKIIEGSYKFKCDKVSNHFMFEKKHDKYDGFITDGDKLQQKIKS